MDDKTQEVVFNANDVAKTLGYVDVKQALRDHTKGGVVLTTPSPGGPQKMKYLTEPDLYRLIMASKLPDAVKFQDWVCEVILPQIRKTGGYIPVTAQDDEKTILCKAVGILKVTLPDYRFITLVGTSTAMMTLLSDVQKKNGSKAPARLNGWSHWDGLSGSGKRQLKFVIDQLINDITREYNITTVVNTHDMNSVLGIGDHITFLSGGQVAWTGNKDNILQQNECESLHRFLYAAPTLQRIRL